MILSSSFCSLDLSLSKCPTLKKTKSHVSFEDIFGPFLIRTTSQVIIFLPLNCWFHSQCFFIPSIYCIYNEAHYKFVTLEPNIAQLVRLEKIQQLRMKSMYFCLVLSMLAAWTVETREENLGLIIEDLQVNKLTYRPLLKLLPTTYVVQGKVIFSQVPMILFRGIGRKGRVFLSRCRSCPQRGGYVLVW